MQLHKSEMRKQMKCILNAMSISQRMQKSEKIVKRLMDQAFFLDATNILFYHAMAQEVDLSTLMETARSMKKTVLLPLCRDNFLMEARAVYNKEDLVSGAYGIMEPHPSKCPIVEPQNIDLIFVPGLAFDENGGRLGRGAGYYDRYLSVTKATRVGVCFTEQMTSAIPMSNFDIYMNLLINDEAIIGIEKPKSHV